MVWLLAETVYCDKAKITGCTDAVVKGITYIGR